MDQLYATAKSLHLIGMVSWMAGMFYLVRIMVYHAMALKKEGASRDTLVGQYGEMERKAYRIILQPAVVITWTFGTIMLFIQPLWLREGWMHIKLCFLVLLTFYTHGLKSHIRLLESGDTRHSHIFYRVWNEIPTFFLAGIVFLAVFKNRINYLYLLLGLAVFGFLLYRGIRKVAQKTDAGSFK